MFIIVPNMGLLNVKSSPLLQAGVTIKVSMAGSSEARRGIVRIVGVSWVGEIGPPNGAHGDHIAANRRVRKYFS